MSEAKSQLVQSWLLRAQHDLAAASVLADSAQSLLDTAIYHCQQAGEKAVKAFLTFRDQPFERVHDVGALIRLAMQQETTFSSWEEAGILLTPYASLFRYPGPVVVPSREEFDQALALAQGLYTFVLSVLPPEVWPSP